MGIAPLFEFQRIGGRGNVVKYDIDLRKEKKERNMYMTYICLSLWLLSK